MGLATRALANLDLIVYNIQIPKRIGQLGVAPVALKSDAFLSLT